MDSPRTDIETEAGSRVIAGVGLSHLERSYLDDVADLLRRRGCTRREQSRANVIRLHIHDAATFFDLPPSMVELLLSDMRDRGIEDRATYFKQLLSDRAKVLVDRGSSTAGRAGPTHASSSAPSSASSAPASASSRKSHARKQP